MLGLTCHRQATAVTASLPCWLLRMSLVSHQRAFSLIRMWLSISCGCDSVSSRDTPDSPLSLFPARCLTLPAWGELCCQTRCLPCQSCDLESEAHASSFECKVRWSWKLIGLELCHSLVSTITNAWGRLNIRGARFPPLSEKIRVSLSPMVTFRAGNYPTQCPSTLKFNTEIRCVVEGPEKFLIFLAI